MMLLTAPLTAVLELPVLESMQTSKLSLDFTFKRKLGGFQALAKKKKKKTKQPKCQSGC